MSNQHLQQKFEQASKQIKEAQETMRLSQGSDAKLVHQAQQQLEQAEQELQSAQAEADTEATENPQFQQAYEQLHDTRQHVDEIHRQLHDDLQDYE